MHHMHVLIYNMFTVVHSGSCYTERQQMSWRKTIWTARLAPQTIFLLWKWKRLIISQPNWKCGSQYVTLVHTKMQHTHVTTHKDTHKYVCAYKWRLLDSRESSPSPKISNLAYKIRQKSQGFVLGPLLCLITALDLNKHLWGLWRKEVALADLDLEWQIESASSAAFTLN